MDLNCADHTSTDLPIAFSGTPLSYDWPHGRQAVLFRCCVFFRACPNKQNPIQKLTVFSHILKSE